MNRKWFFPVISFANLLCIAKYFDLLIQKDLSFIFFILVINTFFCIWGFVTILCFEDAHKAINDHSVKSKNRYKRRTL